MENDGSHECMVCHTPLNATDANCWRCGSKDIVDLRPLTRTADAVYMTGASTSDYLTQVDAQLDALIENFNAGWKP